MKNPKRFIGHSTWGLYIYIYIYKSTWNIVGLKVVQYKICLKIEMVLVISRMFAENKPMFVMQLYISFRIFEYP